MDPQLLLYLISGLGLLGGVGLAIKAVLERRAVAAKAQSDEATATVVLTAAARELIDPLRQELAKERAEHAAEIQAERKKIGELRRELDAAMESAQNLRRELGRAWDEVRQLREENAALKARLGA